MSALVSATLIPLTLLAIALVTSPASAKVYKFVDENGVVSFSDKPSQGSSEVKIRQTRPSNTNADDDEGEGDESVEETASSDEEGDNKRPAITYRSLQVLTPRQDKVLDPENGAVQVILLPTPSLGDNHELVISVDGRDISQGRDVNLSVTNLPNGNHTVAGRIIDPDGKVIIQSRTINFEINESE